MSSLIHGLAERLRRSWLYRRTKLLRAPRIRGFKPSPAFTAVLLVAVAVFMAGGGVYDLMEKPLAILPGPGQQWTFYVPYDINRQTLNESVMAMFLFSIGVSGCFMYYWSTRYVFRPRQATILLLIGVSLMAIAFFGCQFMLNAKIPVG